MRIDRRWVAGMAALLMAAFLLTAMPREGAALPIRYWMGPGGPQFGDPDVPFDGAILWRPDGLWVRLGGLQMRVGISPVPSLIVVGSVKQPTTIRARSGAR